MLEHGHQLAQLLSHCHGLLSSAIACDRGWPRDSARKGVAERLVVASAPAGLRVTPPRRLEEDCDRRLWCCRRLWLAEATAGLGSSIAHAFALSAASGRHPQSAR